VTRLAVGVAAAEGMGPVVDGAGPRVAVAPRAAVGVRGAAVDAGRVDTDLSAGAVGVGHALAGRHGHVATDAGLTGLARGAVGGGVAAEGAATVDADASGSTLCVEVADVRVCVARARDAGEARGAVGARRAVTASATAGRVGDAHAVHADHPGGGAISGHAARSRRRRGRGLGWVQAGAIATDRALRTIGVGRALGDATRVGADAARGALVVTEAGRSGRRFDRPTSETVAVEATGVVAVVVLVVTGAEREAGGKDETEDLKSTHDVHPWVAGVEPCTISRSSCRRSLCC